MKINNVSINNFGKFSEFNAEFGSGINVIKGANEAGKSTLVEAIKAGLFVDSKSKKKTLKDRFKWGAEGAKVYIGLSAEDGEYDLNKDFLSGVQVIEDKQNYSRMETKESWDKFLENEIGISDADLFNATACVRQDEMEDISKSSDILRDRLEGIITGGQEEVVASKVINDLNKRISEIKKEGAKDPGILKRLEDEAENLTYEIEKLTRELEETEARRGELVDVTSILDNTISELNEKSELLEKWDAAHKAQLELTQLEEKYNDLKSRFDEIEESQKKVISYREQIYGKPEILKRDIENIDELETKLRYLQSKLSDNENDEKILKNEVSKVKGIGLFAGLNVVNFFFILGCFAAGFLIEPIVAAGSGFFIITQIVFVVMVWKRSAERAALKSQLRFTSKRVEENKSEIENSCKAINEILEKYSLKNTTNMKDVYELVESTQRKIHEETSRYEHLLGGKNQKVLQGQLEAVTKDLALVRERSQSVGGLFIDPNELLKLRTRVQELSETKIKTEEKFRLISHQLEVSGGGAEELSTFHERFEHNRSMFERYNHNQQVYMITASLIETARANILKATAELLENKVGKYLSDITNDRYNKIRFDKTNLDFSVYSPDKRDWVNSEDLLSRGTIDQIYLCARLALLEILAGERKPFLILDDPFVHFDADRTKNAMVVIKEISKDYQVLLFTNSDNYDQNADQVIQL